MAKESIVDKNKKTSALIQSMYKIRTELGKKMLDSSLDNEELFKVMKVLDKTRRGSYIRYRNRCAITGRPRGYRGGVGLCRGALRHYASFGLIAGLKKN